MSNAAKIFRDALAALISEMKRDWRGDRHIPLRNGKRKELGAIGAIYSFSWSDPAELVFEGARVKFQSGGTSSDATVVLVTPESIFLLLACDLGERIGTATIVIDQTSFLDGLRRRMDDIANGKAENFNSTLADAVLDNKQSSNREGKLKGTETLSAEQRRFIGLALAEPIVWLWGPPGTGKTWTLTALVEELRSKGERVLIISNTNKAVDQVLLSLCRRVGRDHPEIVKGEYVRVGRIAHPELEREWLDFVWPEKIAERLTTGQRSKVATFREEQRRLKNDRETLASGKDRKDYTAAERARIEEIDQCLAKISAELSSLQREIDEITAKVVVNAKVVGATVTKTFLSPAMFSEFDAVLLDEASMVVLPACYHAAGVARRRVVISGDFRQLPPILPTESVEITKTIGLDIFERAGITQSVDSGRPVPNLVMLTDQWRYPPAICDLVSRPMYGGRLRTALQREKSPVRCPDPFQEPITLIDTSDTGGLAVRHLARGSRLNFSHTLLVRNLIRHLVEKGTVPEPRNIGVISPYAAQAELLSKARRLDGAGAQSPVPRAHDLLPRQLTKR